MIKLLKFNKKPRGFESKKSLYGFCFIIPWLIGIIALFIIPLGKSLWYSVCEVGFADSGEIVTDFIGLENISYIFKIDPDFVTNLGTSISEFAFSFPIIVILSLIFAIILNQKFLGRVFARAIFFLDLSKECFLLLVFRQFPVRNHFFQLLLYHAILRICHF